MSDDDEFNDEGDLIDGNNDETQFIDDDEQVIEVELLLSGSSTVKLIDRRDRLKHPQSEDEPSDPEYHRFLDAIYERLNQSNRLRMSAFQMIRTEYLIGMYCESQHLFALAAEHYRHGAEVAQQIPDLALVAQLKYRESRACARPGSPIHTQFQRTFETASDAWKTWQELDYRDTTEDVYFEFKLADNVAASAVQVAEYDIAADFMEKAGVRLHRISGRADFNPKKYANIDLFLTWDWTTVSIAKNDYRDAFKRILQTRRKGKDLLRPINRVRLQWLIALIALNCAEQDPSPRRSSKRPTLKKEHNPAERYTYDRLLVVAEKAIDAAYDALNYCEDERGRALTLLAEAKLLGMFRIEEDRIDKIKEAEAIASTIDDSVLRGHVDIAWGDEKVFQGKWREAKEIYLKVAEEMSQLKYLELANFARQRLARLERPSRAKPSQEAKTPPDKPNDPPPDDKLPLN